MSETRRITFYLDDDLRPSVAAGEHNFFARLQGVLEDAGYAVSLRPSGAAARLEAPLRAGWALFHMEAPTHARALTVRRAYHYPFWAIETTDRRWDWHVSRTPFPSGEVPRREADGFHRRWARRLFGDAPEAACRDAMVYIPLQGRLAERRSFQSCTPLQMIEATLSADPQRAVEARLHPKEIYTPQELAALDALAAQHPHLTVGIGGKEEALARCAYVVTMNSSVAFDAMFFRKPAILFGQIDFHHVMLAATLGDLSAFERVMDHAPDFAGYLWWYWQRMSVNAGHETAEARIRAALTRCGLPL
ncbi:hypothetical protein [Maritimibacter alkaliphilus]|uniref:hypothetical protein n=1 Tax=Maritimibacter alkaliphilus TaxID=404236 RepID=UPI001C982B25|nr:hypothetical protein [Maritimibacter alkaliphilus]MBY6090508.1 hypothetical protein [Maritimibacter alkaliphilus]